MRTFEKMKSIQVVLQLLAAFLAAQAFEDNKENVPIFIDNLMQLYRGPPFVAGVARAVNTEWIEQKLDHFNEEDTRTWQMRYMVNDEYFEEGGPIFIYVGGEWEIYAGSISSGHFVDVAREHKGILFYTEHRYYGASRPFADLTVDSLKYQHVKQALADLAHFIRNKRETVPALANSKVIMAGGSYAATMVVWFKRLYPELLTGGWASSAPILAKVNFVEYKEMVGRALRELGSEQCYNRIQNGVAGLEQMFAENRGAEVKAMLKICDNFDEHNDLDIWSLFGSISNVFSGIVQYQSGDDVPRICNELVQNDDDDVTALAKFLLNRFYFATCLDFRYKDTVSYYADTTYQYGASRPWYYQTCNEYGWYQTSGSSNQPFGTKFPVTLYTTICSDAFGTQYANSFITDNAEKTNQDFGGLNPEVENIHMTHGEFDPWATMGHGVSDGAVVIPRASHCADFGSISDQNTPEMRASKEKFAQLVREWLSDETAK